MAQTVIGFFEDIADAKHAMERLENMGIARQEINITKEVKEPSPVNSNGANDPENRNNGIAGFFNSLFGNDSSAAERYSKVSRGGYTMLTVQVQSREEAERAADLLDECGAIDIDERAAQGSIMHTAVARQSVEDRNHSQSINRIQEHLDVGRRTVEQGGVRVRSRIVERPFEEQVRLREERVHIERQPVDRPISATELNNFQEGDLELIERAEVPVINKQARVVEEIRISKDITERDQIVRDTVRNTEVDIENVNKTGQRPDRNDVNFNDSRTL
jgi:stress response protein YsnF